MYILLHVTGFHIFGFILLEGVVSQVGSGGVMAELGAVS